MSGLGLLRRIVRKIKLSSRYVNPYYYRQPRVLVLGIYLADRHNLVRHIVQTLGETMRYRVTQRWAALNGDAPAAHVAAVTCLKVDRPTPKFQLLNTLVDGLDLSAYRYILLFDDDIILPDDFLANFISRQESYDFALAQPARTHDSYIDHRIVEQVDEVDARRTRFVEIGPVVSIRYDAVSHLMPFDTECGMGWGLDFVWPVIIEASGLKMGIIDATPIRHALRPPAVAYSLKGAEDEMKHFLKNRSHLEPEQAMVVLESFARR